MVTVLKETHCGVFLTSKHSIWVPDNMFLKLFAENSFEEQKSRLPLFPSVSVPSEYAVSGVCSFNATELLSVAYKLAVRVNHSMEEKWCCRLVTIGGILSEMPIPLKKSCTDLFQSLYACGSTSDPKQHPKSKEKCCFHESPLKCFNKSF